MPSEVMLVSARYSGEDFVQRLDEAIFGRELEERSDAGSAALADALESLKGELLRLDYRSAKMLCMQIDRLVVPRLGARDVRKLADVLGYVDPRLTDACPAIREMEARRLRARKIGEILAPERLDRLTLAFRAVAARMDKGGS